MTAIEGPPIVERLQASRTLVVALSSGGVTSGVVLPPTSHHGDRPLGLGDLVALHALVAGADNDELVARVAEAACSSDGLAELVAELKDRQLVAPMDSSRPTESVVALPDAPAVEAVAFDPSLQLLVASPRMVQVTPDGFELVDHDGRREAVLSPVELLAVSELLRPIRIPRAVRMHEQRAGAAALDEASFVALVERLRAVGVVQAMEDGATRRDDAAGRQIQMFREEIQRERALVASIAASLAECDAEEAARRERTGTARTRVVPVQHNGNLAPLALGILFAYAKAYDDGALDEHYQFYPSWMTRLDRVPRLLEGGPAIFLFSNYHWSHAENLAVSDAVKAASPACLTIHGGPDTPKYAGDVDGYFELHPSVDIVVHGEGEETFAALLEALVPALGWTERPDLTALDCVAGLSYRRADGSVHRTDDRDRITDLDTIPSPYLTGLFDAYGEASAPTAIIESNRGCPYGCTFCDWGSATLSRIRKFDLDRVLAEIEWCARNGVPRIFMADANFGIFERDVQIAEKVAAMKKEYGYPKSFVTNYAKNTVKHLRRIVEVMIEAGIFTEGLLSLQSMDEGTLDTIKRSNIKLEKYEQLAREFRKAKLPLYVDLMLGLPGSTVSSFKSDLQQCVDREVTAKIFLTELLVNSPMNAPDYRALHQIQTATDRHGMYGAKEAAAGTTSRALLVSTASYTREDYEEMKRIRAAFILCENYGALRQVARHVRQVSGLPEIELYDRLRLTVRADRERLPHMALLLEVVPKLMVSPVSWQLFLDEVRGYVVDELGLVDDDALDTAFVVQHALLPSRDRVLPVRLQLAHDMAAWHKAVIEAKDEGHNSDWPDIVPPLASFGPATFVVEDPFEVCTRGLGYPMDNDGYANWEMQSAVSRPLPPRHLV